LPNRAILANIPTMKAGVVLAAPILGTLLAVAWPLARYVSQERGHAAALAFLREAAAAQEAFRGGAGDSRYVTALDSLITPCNGRAAPFSADRVRALEASGYAISMRPAASASTGAPDCHGRPTASDYYLALEPASPEASVQRAHAMTGNGRIFAFFDGVPPREADMTAGGLAVPSEELPAFRIP
jgi:hypothetical protein